MKKNKEKISYDSESDILMWEVANKPIDFAKEIGNIVVHFTKNSVPVLVEILEASKFLTKANTVARKDVYAADKKLSLALR